jgi:hypothetical protein
MTINPWDIPPLPKKGDASKSITYEAVGLALSNWESFEFGLGLIFITLLRADEGIAARRAYGSIITFRGRLEMIEAAAEAYFLIHRAPRVKADFRSLMNRAQKYGARRNEIAHGQVKEFRLDRRRKAEGWALCPSHFSSNKITLSGTRQRRAYSLAPTRLAVTKPRYIYTSAEISAFAECFRELGDEAAKLLRRVSDLWLSPLARTALKHPEKLSPQQRAMFEKRLRALAPQPRPSKPKVRH